MKNGFYVYRFKNKEDVIVYVGRTTNLNQRFKQHDHLTKDIKDIEYIVCTSEAEMMWKEIYYINLFYNENSTNVADVYSKGKMNAIDINDIWRKYKRVLNTKRSTIITREDYMEFIKSLPKYNYHKLINIVDNEKMNSIGNDKYSLSEKWFNLNENINHIIKLKNNIYNYFNNYKYVGRDNFSSYRLWTTYSEHKEKIKGKGYTKGFIDLYCSSENCTEKTELAYIANIFYPVAKKEYELSEDEYALFHLLSFIFSSGIRDGKRITVYIPSKRMRNLLVDWIEYQEYE